MHLYSARKDQLSTDVWMVALVNYVYVKGGYCMGYELLVPIYQINKSDTIK